MTDRKSAGSAAFVVRAVHGIVSENPEPSMEEVLAYAQDRDSGELRYILELSVDQRGARCNCICADCAAPLIAVNAATTDWKRRPHFRHPPGTLRRTCATGAARAAALRMLLRDGVIDLPRRSRSGGHRGLSGSVYEGASHVVAQRKAVRSYTLIDRVGAELILDDGRRLKVLVTGTQEPSSTGPDPGVATIYLDVDDPQLAALPPAELRSRLRLMPSLLCWASHWDDAELQRGADEAASRAAQEALDWPVGEATLLEQVPPALRRETLLHLQVKRILAGASKVRVPACVLHAVAGDEFGYTVTLEDVLLEEQWFSLHNARTETVTGGGIPDVVAECIDEEGRSVGEICFEVTVTHGFDERRAERARTAGLKVLEIDLTVEPGALTLSGLVDRVCTGLTGKRWRALPGAEERQAALDGQARAVVAGWRAEEEATNAERAAQASQTSIQPVRKAREAPSPRPLAHRQSQPVSMQFAQAASWRENRLLHDAIASFLTGEATGFFAGRTLGQIVKEIHRQPVNYHALVLVAVEAGFARGVRWPPSQWPKYTREKLDAGEPAWQPQAPDVALLAQRFPELRERIERTLHVRFTA